MSKIKMNSKNIDTVLAEIQQGLAELKEDVTCKDNKIKELETELAIDPKTGAYTIRVFRHFVEDALREAEGTKYSQKRRRDDVKQQDVAVIVADIDDFKSINDTWNHSYGDDVLGLVADRIQRAVRPRRDKVARNSEGADEFYVLLINPRGQLDQIVKRIKNEVSKIKLRSGKSCTVSLGYATLLQGYDSVADIIKVADKRMYEDKRTYKQKT